MGNTEEYYKNTENTENTLPHPMVKKIIDMNIKPENAIDLGCGAGRDTIYLIKNCSPKFIYSHTILLAVFICHLRLYFSLIIALKIIQTKG